MLVTVATFRLLLDAEIAKGKLAAHNIQAFIYDANMVNLEHQGEISLKVEDFLLDKAKKILDENYQDIVDEIWHIGDLPHYDPFLSVIKNIPINESNLHPHDLIIARFKTHKSPAYNVADYNYLYGLLFLFFLVFLPFKFIILFVALFLAIKFYIYKRNLSGNRVNEENHPHMLQKLIIVLFYQFIVMLIMMVITGGRLSMLSFIQFFYIYFLWPILAVGLIFLGVKGRLYGARVYKNNNKHNYKYPHIIQRIFIMLFYQVMIFMFMGWLWGDSEILPLEKFLVIYWGWPLLIIWVFILGFQGRLYGARRIKKLNENHTILH